MSAYVARQAHFWQASGALFASLNRLAEQRPASAANSVAAIA